MVIRVPTRNHQVQSFWTAPIPTMAMSARKTIAWVSPKICTIFSLSADPPGQSIAQSLTNEAPVEPLGLTSTSSPLCTMSALRVLHLSELRLMNSRILPSSRVSSVSNLPGTSGSSISENISRILGRYVFTQFSGGYSLLVVFLYRRCSPSQVIGSRIFSPQFSNSA